MRTPTTDGRRTTDGRATDGLMKIIKFGRKHSETLLTEKNLTEKVLAEKFLTEKSSTEKVLTEQKIGRKTFRSKFLCMKAAVKKKKTDGCRPLQRSHHSA